MAFRFIYVKEYERVPIVRVCDLRRKSDSIVMVRLILLLTVATAASQTPLARTKRTGKTPSPHARTYSYSPPPQLHCSISERWVNARDGWSRRD